MKSTFISRLKNAMQIANLNQCELSKKSKIRQSSISDWLNGKYVPKQDKIDMLAQALNVTPAYLMGWEEKETSEDRNSYGINKLAKMFENEIFTDEELEFIKNNIEFVLNKKKPSISNNKIKEIDKELEDYRKELESELKGVEKSSALNEHKDFLKKCN